MMIESLPLTDIRAVGEGPAVVLIHPLGANVDYWGELETRLSGRTLISYNLPGHGGRSTAATGYRIEDLAHDLAAVLDARGVDSASIVGVSIGGLVGQAFAASYPARTQSLLLVDCVPTYPPDFAAGLTKRAEIARQEGLASLLRPTLDLWFTAGTAESDSALTVLVERMLLSTDPQGYAHACEALVAADLRPRAAEIQASTSVLYGEHEVPAFVIGSEWLADNIPGAHRERIAGGKHAASLECSSTFAEILDRLLPR